MIGPGLSFEQWVATLPPDQAARQLEYEFRARLLSDRVALADAERKERASIDSEKRQPFRFADNGDDDPALYSRTLCRESTVIAGLGAARESDYVEHVANTAGYIMGADEFKRSHSRRWERYQQTVDLAASLERTGIRCLYTGDKTRPAPSIVCPLSRTVIRLPSIRRVNFFPETAAASRAQLLRNVEHYLERHPFSRMATFTSGKRVLTKEIRRRHGALKRKLSRLASQPWFKARAELVFVALEYGTPELSPCGDYLWHVHAHTVFRPRHYQPPKRWAKFCKKISRFVGARWDAGEQVQNPRELVKYPFKPRDLTKLLEVGRDDVVRELFDQTLKLRMAETLGSLREQRRSVTNTKRRRLKEQTSSGDWVTTTRRDWNRSGRSITRHAARLAAQAQRARKKRRDELDALRPEAHAADGSGAPQMLNRIVARLAPAPYASRVYEPAFYVWNFNGDFDAIARHLSARRALEVAKPRVDLARELLAEEFRQAAAGGHNSTHQSGNCPVRQIDFPGLNGPPGRFARQLEAVSA